MINFNYLLVFFLLLPPEFSHAEETLAIEKFGITGVTEDPSITTMVEGLRDELADKLDPSKPPIPIANFAVFIALDDIVRDGRAFFGDDLSSLPPPMASLSGFDFEGEYCGVGLVALPNDIFYIAMMADTAKLTFSEVRQCAVTAFAYVLGLRSEQAKTATIIDLLEYN